MTKCNGNKKIISKKSFKNTLHDNYVGCNES